jgi:glutamate/tyrosine decarboxylase-like PLP-dependent enzyme
MTTGEARAMGNDLRAHLRSTSERVAAYREQLATASVMPDAQLDDLVAAFDRPLEDGGAPTAEVLDELVTAAERGLVASAGPRYFGFVTGGSVDAALCADILACGWDQLAFNAVSSPGSFAVEVVAGRWVKELLRLPAHSSIGFVTGGQAANTVGLAAARASVLAAAGWDDRDGLFGAPSIRVLASDERHATIDRSLRLLGIGDRAVVSLESDAQGALTADAVARELASGSGEPTIVCVQAGNVATGAFDEIGRICDIAHDHDAWVHVDGAFGLWASANPSARHLVEGFERADSWACDAHKWLNVPYDSGFAICAHPEMHTRAMRYTAAYLSGQDGPPALAAADLTLESSRRARGMAVWAAIRELGASGVAELVGRCCALAQRFAAQLRDIDGIDVVNDVVLNQVLVSFGDDAETDRVVSYVQDEGVCWVGATTWRGRRLMRISVSSWLTTAADVDVSVQSMVAAHRKG